MKTSRLVVVVAVSLALVATGCQARAYDFDGDGAADRMWIDPAGTWWRGTSMAGAQVVFAGTDADDAVPADYDGDGRVDVAVVRDRHLWLRADGSLIVDFPRPAGIAAGYGADIVPVPGYWDGGDRAVPAWYRQSDATWFIAGRAPVQFGRGATDPTVVSPGYPLKALDGDYPAPADYDGDGTTDLSVYNPLSGAWAVRASHDGSVSTVTLRVPDGSQLLLPVPGAYDGIGRAKRALHDGTNWYIEGHAQPMVFGPGSGSTWSMPAPADYDGDGRTDLSTVDDHGLWRIAGAFPALQISPPATSWSRPTAMPTALLYSVARLTFVQKCLQDPAAC